MVLIAFPFLRTPKIYLFFERCCQNCPHLMRSSFVGAAKKEVYYFEDILFLFLKLIDGFLGICICLG